MKYYIECLYCGHKWTENLYREPSNDSRCGVCRDLMLKYKSEGQSKVDYYEGCPAFVKKPKDDEDLFPHLYYDSLD